MPAPKPKEEPHRVEPKEAGASGGAPAEANPPHTITLEELDRMLVKRLAEEIGKEYEFTLITVEPDGNIEANFYDDLKDVAQKILEQIEEVVASDLTQDLPETASYWEALMITVEDNGRLYTVVEEWNRWEAIHKIPAHKATLYITSDEVLSSISNIKLYVRGKAVMVRGTIFYQVEIDRDQVKDLEAELKLLVSNLLGESP